MPEIMPDALRALRACQQDPQVTETTTSFSFVEVEQFCRLWHPHDYFINSLMAYFSANLDTQFGNKEQSSASETVTDLTRESLSAVELARVQRAMLRYSTFQCMMKDSLSKDVPGFIRHLASFGLHTPWEMEEVVCVHQFILERLQDVIKKVEDYFVDSVRAEEQKSTSRYLPENPGGPFCLESEEAELPFFEQGDYFFTKRQKYKQRKTLQHLSSLGFPFVRSLLNASPDLQKYIIVKSDHDFRWGLTKFLVPRSPDLGIFEDEYASWLSKRLLESEGDDLQKRNLAWLWAHRNRPDASYCWRCNRDVRDWGYVFWDSDRLRRWGIVNEPRPDFNYNDLAPHYKARESLFDRPSAQERLREFGLA